MTTSDSYSGPIIAIFSVASVIVLLNLQTFKVEHLKSGQLKIEFVEKKNYSTKIMYSVNCVYIPILRTGYNIALFLLIHTLSYIHVRCCILSKQWMKKHICPDRRLQFKYMVHRNEINCPIVLSLLRSIWIYDVPLWETLNAFTIDFELFSNSTGKFRIR